jgi:uncharacterized protein YrrD
VGTGTSAVALLQRPVMMRGIRLGDPFDVVLDAEARRVVGIDVLCGDDVHRFLPLPAARIRPGEIAVGSALLLLEERDADFYRRHARTFRSLQGATVERGGMSLGELEDLLIDEDGEIVALQAGGERVALDTHVAITAMRKASVA